MQLLFLELIIFMAVTSFRLFSIKLVNLRKEEEGKSVPRLPFPKNAETQNTSEQQLCLSCRGQKKRQPHQSRDKAVNQIN